MIKKTVVLPFCTAVLLSLGAFGASPVKRYQAEFLSLFDTVTTVVGFAPDKRAFTALVEEVRDKLREYNDLYDIYHEYDGLNNLKTVNDNAGIRPVRVDARILDLLEFAREAYEATGGAVNIAMGAVLSIWHEYRENGIDNPAEAALPPMEALKRASRHTDMADVVLDRQASTVYLKDPDMRLDVGAVAKGYAVEQTALYFEGRGVKNLLLSVGGNIRAIGGKITASGQEAPWAVGIRNPNKESAEDLTTVAVWGGSLVTSGGYERYYTVDGRRYHHIIDPQTLMPNECYQSISILCRDSGLADALSTAVFNMPLEAGKAYIESLPDTEALWVLADGTVTATSGFEKNKTY